MRPISIALACAFLAACSSSSSKSTTDSGTPSDTGTTADTPAADAPATIVEHGSFVDFSTLNPLPGLTITDNGQTTTTDANGDWSLTVPASSLLQPTVTGPKYSTLLFPDAKPVGVGTDVDFANAVTATSAVYSLEQSILPSFDKTKALVHIVLIPTGACTSLAGGTITVTAPTGTMQSYFDTTGIPDTSLTATTEPQGDRPIAVVYNIPVGATFTYTASYPSCTLAAYPTTYNGKVYPAPYAPSRPSRTT